MVQKRGMLVSHNNDSKPLYCMRIILFVFLKKNNFNNFSLAVTIRAERPDILLEYSQSNYRHPH